MLLPAGQDVWTDLSSFFVNLDNLIYYIRHHDFNGYICFTFQEDKSIVYFHEGEAVCGVTEDKAEEAWVVEPVHEILNRCRQQKNVILDVRKLPVGSLEIIAEVLKLEVEPVHKELSSEFLNLDKLISKLQSKGFSGYIEIKFPQNDKTGLLYFKNGEIAGVLDQSVQLSQEASTAKNRKLFQEAKKELVHRAKDTGIIYNVYKASGSNSPI